MCHMGQVGDWSRPPLAYALTARTPVVRRAANSTLATELVKTSTSLSRKLQAYSEHPYAAEIGELCTTYADAGLCLGAISTSLLHRCIHTAEQRAQGGGLAFRIASAAGATVLGSLSWATCLLVQHPSPARLAEALPLHLDMVAKLLIVLGHLRCEQEGAFKAIRATVCSPDAIMACLRRVPWHELPNTNQQGRELINMF